MDIALTIMGGILLLLGILGCFLPVLPGPILSLVALMLLQVAYKPFSVEFLIIWTIVVILVTVLDYIIPILGTKKMGGSRRGINGSVIGLMIGFFLLPGFGIIIGPFVGAYVGEYLRTKNIRTSFRPAIGSFLGFMTGIILKLIISIILSIFFFKEIIALLRDVL